MLDFAKLGYDFFTEVEARSLENCFLIHKNQALQNQLKLNISDNTLLKICSAKQKLNGIQPIASLYAGHQFGHFVPQLGDGRSCLIGQLQNFEISLKGAGTTPYSRGADGRTVLRSSVREYLCSAAMQGLGIASTQALALVGSTTEVYREQIEMGAIITRVAPSHIRFGHFEVFASRGQKSKVKQLLDFVIEHYYPQLSGKNRYLDCLLEVVKSTAKMIAKWQAQGFTHGVMNTDNMSILGLTLDFGPFGFLETYNPHFICNHSDYEGRYAFDQQPAVALWNLSRLADSLASIIDAKQAKSVLAHYQSCLIKEYSVLMRQKFGLIAQNPEDNILIQQFLNLLYKHKKDYTNSLRILSQNSDKQTFGTAFDAWFNAYWQRLSEEQNPNRAALMNRANPKFILRNYLAQIAIKKAEDTFDYTEINTLFTLLSSPFAEHQGFDSYTEQAPDWAQDLSLSCSS